MRLPAFLLFVSLIGGASSEDIERDIERTKRIPANWNGIRCRSCRGARTQQQCDSIFEYCKGYSVVCETLINTNSYGQQFITKRCAHPNHCRAVTDTFCGDGHCSACCTGDLCNTGAPNVGGNTNGGNCDDSDCPGPRGPAGIPGLPGDMGPPGIPGLKGEPGFLGPPATCSNGPKGERGEQGQQGTKGDVGYPGPFGDPGYPGLNGSNGTDGQPGLKGDPGAPGPPGYNGLPGFRGVKGHSGQCSKCPGRKMVAFAAHADDVTQSSSKYENISFNAVRVNFGDGYDSETSCFKTPVSGLYHFTVTVISEGSGATPVSLFVDGQEMAHTARVDKSAVGPYPIGTNTVLLPLAKGNEVCLKVQPQPTSVWGDIVNLFRSPSQVTIEGHLVASAPTSS